MIRLFKKADEIPSPLFYGESILHPNNEITGLSGMELSWFECFEESYHYLIKELVDLQVEKIRLVLNDNKLKKIFLDGGFVDNDIFINILMEKLLDFQIIPSEIPLGSAIGVSMAVNNESHPVFKELN